MDYSCQTSQKVKAVTCRSLRQWRYINPFISFVEPFIVVVKHNAMSVSVPFFSPLNMAQRSDEFLIHELKFAINMESNVYK